MKHHYLAFPSGGVASLAKLAQVETELHDLDGFLTGPEGNRWRIVASERIHGFEKDGGDVALYYVIPASVPPHHEALYLSQQVVRAATK
ncbi:hypothetical protein IME_EC2_37 [Enterobacteria phage IME_EC2]|uniref:Uncharacterized protein n=1 Tax=Enterobacteria phage IME_EC2 TaxID=1414766 RepID=A0A0A0P0H3_9CAUD|nr:hypothetical protein HOQ93_gp37 [Enterobacteria phage IME_EC2]AGZ17828.1 hypothetical protein IME_EC2_37 [Enterobacteria phage IME_EC2]